MGVFAISVLLKESRLNEIIKKCTYSDRRGPRTEPWSTPALTGPEEDAEGREGEGVNRKEGKIRLKIRTRGSTANEDSELTNGIH